MTDKPERKCEAVRALTRGLAILQHVNAVGEAKPGDIAKALAIPRSSVYRLLETLEEAGYVAFSASASCVRVTRLAASLGDGSALGSSICQTAAPLLAQYAAQLVWPLDLTIHHNAAMVVQETTHGRSPLSIDRGMVGSCLPMLRTSAGRAYLTFCDQTQRDLILAHIRRLGEKADEPFLEPLWLARMMYETRERRVALRDAGEFRPQTASLAAPIMASNGIVGCVSMIWIRSALNTQDAIESYATPLTELAGRIAASLSDAHTRPASREA